MELLGCAFGVGLFVGRWVSEPAVLPVLRCPVGLDCPVGGVGVVVACMPVDLAVFEGLACAVLELAFLGRWVSEPTFGSALRVVLGTDAPFLRV